MANLKELINTVSTNTGLTKKDTETTLREFLNVIKTTVVSGEEISLPEFGKFETTTRAARNGRNPKSGEVIKIDESKGIKFKVGKSFKEMLK